MQRSKDALSETNHLRRINCDASSETFLPARFAGRHSALIPAIFTTSPHFFSSERM